MKNILFFMFSIGLMQFWACGPAQNDTEVPSLQVVESPIIVTDSVCGSLANNVMHLRSSDSLVLILKLADNDLLSQLKIDIHDNFDCHGHAQKTEDWTLQQLVDLQTNNITKRMAIAVPQHVTAGAYHLTLRLLDVSGNEAEPLYFSLKVLNSDDVIAPKMILNNPYIHNLELDKNETLNLNWQMNDNKSLGNSTNAKSVLKYLDIASGNSFTIAELVVDDSVEIFEKKFNYKYLIPKTWISGNDYLFQIWGYDAVNNRSKPIEISLKIK
ncbi:MAG: DUF4625 domain-containing protein [Bacteroidia bacterium]